MPSIKEILARLDGLYGKTQTDWVLDISLILTEPVCPTVSIAPEGSNTTRYTTTRGTIEEGLEAAVDLVYREVFLGERIEREYPITNSDDHDDGPTVEEHIEEEERRYFKRRLGEYIGLTWRIRRHIADAFPQYRWDPPPLDKMVDELIARALLAAEPPKESA